MSLIQGHVSRELEEVRRELWRCWRTLSGQQHGDPEMGGCSVCLRSNKETDMTGAVRAPGRVVEVRPGGEVKQRVMEIYRLQLLS